MGFSAANGYWVGGTDELLASRLIAFLTGLREDCWP